MATVAVSPNEPDLAAADQCVIMHNVGWEGYLRVLRARGEKRRPKLLYLDGDVHLMSPAYAHEQLIYRLSMFVTETALALDLPCKSSGATTFRRRKKKAGAEADASFYLASATQIHGRRDLSLRRDPPPDLVIEVVNTHPADAAVEAWRRFQVPEVWVADISRVQILTRQDDGAYAEATHSRSFPVLAATEIFEWMTRDLGGLDSDWIKQLRVWVREVLLPRARGGA
jgi:Uma2 family endonuclease